jgi:diguanylate cyclase (GGDEF)-like protein
MGNLTMNIRGATTPKAGKVLTINRDPEVIRILEVNLTHANLAVISADNGAAALRKAHTEKPDVILLDPALPDMDGLEVCQRLKESQHSNHIPVILIGAKRSKYKTIMAVDNAVQNIPKPFDPKEVVTLVQAYLRRKERTENINPLTGLPNKLQVTNEITELIEQNKSFTALYIAMDNLKAFNKVYGYSHGDHAIGLLANIVSEAVRMFGNPEDLAGHLGSDKFVIITKNEKARNLCRRIITDFNGRLKSLYTIEDLQTGYIEYESPLGRGEQSPIICLRIAAVNNQKHAFRHHLEVSEAAAEQLAYLRRFPGSNCYFDLRDIGMEPDSNGFRTGIPHAPGKELKDLQGVLAWFAFLTSEINTPIMVINDCLNRFEAGKSRNILSDEHSTLITIRENINQLSRIFKGLESLITTECPFISSVPDEINLIDILNWVIEQIQERAEQKRIAIDIRGIEAHLERLIVDGNSLTQSLLYLLRAEVELSSPKDQIHIYISDNSEESIDIQVHNSSHNIPDYLLDMILQDQPVNLQSDAPRNELYIARLLLQGLGGNLNIICEKGKGTNYTITLPKRWQSWMQEINALLYATDTSRKEAHTELDNIQHLLSELVEKIPPALYGRLDRLHSRVQELGVLCNRSLFLTEDFNSRLEKQQDRLLQQEAEQLSMLEALLAISSQIAGQMHIKYIFNNESAQRVAKNAMIIANEFRLSESERQALHHAALLKDLALALSPQDMRNQMVVPTMEEAIAVRAQFNLVWKSLSTIPFLSRALVFIMYRYEKYDGVGNRFGAKSTSIPLGARILAVADTFDSLTSGLLPRGALSPKMAVQEIVDNLGIRFDPDIINAFMRVWRRKELDSASGES